MAIAAYPSSLALSCLTPDYSTLASRFRPLPHQLMRFFFRFALKSAIHLYDVVAVVVEVGGGDNCDALVRKTTVMATVAMVLVVSMSGLVITLG